MKIKADVVLATDSPQPSTRKISGPDQRLPNTHKINLGELLFLQP
jgi:hypothetical protein